MRIAFRREALADLEAVFDFVARNNPTAARAVIRRVRLSVERLSRFPRSGRVGIVPGTRELVVPGLPYIVVYTISGDTHDGFVDVVAIFHAAQDRRSEAE